MSYCKKCGYLELFFGPMWSGKSTKMAERIAEYADLGMRCVVVNHLKDERVESSGTYDDGKFSQHGSSNFHLSDHINKLKTDSLSTIDVSDYDVIAVDECQFFDKDLLEEIPKWVNKEHKIVICAGLDGDAECNLFGNILYLIPYADKVKKLQAQCTVCLEELRKSGFRGMRSITANAPFSARLVASKGSQILVGGSESYTVMCRYHHQKHLSSVNSTKS